MGSGITLTANEYRLSIGRHTGQQLLSIRRNFVLHIEFLELIRCDGFVESTDDSEGILKTRKWPQKLRRFFIKYENK